jgi:hypothetical protein
MECGKAEFRSYFTWFLYPEALTIRPEAALSLLPLGMLKIAVRSAYARSKRSRCSLLFLALKRFLNWSARGLVDVLR